MALTIEIDNKKLEKLLATTPEELDRVMPGVAKRIGYRYLGFHRARRMRGPPGVRATGTPPSERGVNTPPGFRTSGLRAHFRVDVTGSGFKRLMLKMFTKSLVARQHEAGAILKQRSGRYMAIPMSSWGGAKRTKAAIARARQWLRKGKEIQTAGALGFDLRNSKGRLQKQRLVLFTAKDGRKYLAEPPDKKKGIHGRFIIWFHLKKVAKLDARLDFGKLWGDYTATAVKMFNQGLGFALSAARKKANAK